MTGSPALKRRRGSRSARSRLQHRERRAGGRRRRPGVRRASRGRSASSQPRSSSPTSRCRFPVAGSSTGMAHGSSGCSRSRPQSETRRAHLESFALGVAWQRLVGGVGTGIGFVAGSDYVRGTVGTPSAQGLYGAAGVGGAGLAIAIVPLAIPGLDWRAPYVTALVFALPCSSACPWRRGTGRRASVAGAAGCRPSEIVRDRRLYPLAIAHTASFGLSVIVGAWAVSLLKHDGYGRRLAGGVGALALLAGLVTRPLEGRSLQHRPETAIRLVGISMFAGAAGTVLLLLDLPLAVRVAGAAMWDSPLGSPLRRPSSVPRRRDRTPPGPRSGSSTAARRSSSSWGRRWSG